MEEAGKKRESERERQREIGSLDVLAGQILRLLFAPLGRERECS